MSTEESRRTSIEAALKEHESVKGPEVKIPWKGSRQSVPVVRIRLTELLLNHSSHRIKAQLESLPDWADLQTNPESEAAQNEIASAIRLASPGYREILDDLARFGQKDPGVVTRAGILINGNTRAVALRELGEDWLEVAVLPPAASPADLAEVEFRLQMPKDLRQDYTYTNTLLFIQDLLTTHGYTPEKVALEVGFIRDEDKASLKKGAAWVNQSTQALDFIRSVQARTERQTGRRLPLTWFDEKQQAIEEMLAKIEGNELSPTEIEEIKSLRTIGLLSNVVKLNLREVGTDFVEEFLLPALEEEEQLQHHVDFLLPKNRLPSSGSASIPGLSGGQERAGHASGSSALETFLDAVARSHGQASITVNEDPRMTMESEQFRAHVKAAYDEATENARQDRRNQGSLEGPVKSLREATHSLEQAERRLQAMASRGLNLDKFKLHLRKVESRVKSLRKAVDGLGQDA